MANENRVANTQMERCPSCEIVELNQERLVSAVMLALHDVSLRCSTDAAVQWFQQAYSEAIKTLRNADEAEVFKAREGKPTLTGHSTPAAPVDPELEAREAERCRIEGCDPPCFPTTPAAPETPPEGEIG